jgi:hypothetical protein
MSKTIVAGLVAAAMLAIGAGSASAAPATPATSEAGVPIWVLPGLDLGWLLGPTVPVPTQALAPIDGLLKFISG